jgi:anti-anti-sigma regulatory factor
MERSENAGPVVIRIDAAAFGDDPSEWLRERLASAGATRRDVVCDVGGLARPDMATVDTLLRLQVAARRLGHRIRLHRPSAELAGLLVMTGLADFLPLHDSGSRVAQETPTGH